MSKGVRKLDFPQGFVFGAATASYQVKKRRLQNTCFQAFHGFGRIEREIERLREIERDGMNG
jgi:beta-glucosidase/6-phospho-beta-glucosidase/beta-galactosidase